MIKKNEPAVQPRVSSSAPQPKEDKEHNRLDIFFWNNPRRVVRSFYDCTGYAAFEQILNNPTTKKGWYAKCCVNLKFRSGQNAIYTICAIPPKRDDRCYDRSSNHRKVTKHGSRNTVHATRNTVHATRNTVHATRNTVHATFHAQPQSPV